MYRVRLYSGARKWETRRKVNEILYFAWMGRKNFIVEFLDFCPEEKDVDPTCFARKHTLTDKWSFDIRIRVRPDATNLCVGWLMDEWLPKWNAIYFIQVLHFISYNETSHYFPSPECECVDEWKFKNLCKVLGWDSLGVNDRANSSKRAKFTFR